MDTVTLVLLAVVALCIVLTGLFVLRSRRLASRNVTLQGRVEELAKYSAVVDAEAHAAKLLADARTGAATVASEAQGRASEAKADADRLAAKLLSDAARTAEDSAARAASDASALRAEAQSMNAAAAGALDGARAEARAIVERARAEAATVAGDALDAMANAQRYTATAQAMKNVIEGYGDRYVVPTFGLLDELAEDFGFTEAGAKLKEARERTRRMIKDGSAATCDYVEAQRRGYAIDFVQDAFNGKVDTILASTRHDNFGTLERRIRDAFALVNFNGQAFRNARITDGFLAARLDELRWAVVASELKLKDKDEQRALREQIRDEERAQREYERAMKEAAKEEETLKRLREKVQAEFDHATDAQKAKFEAQLAEVNERLRQAEEKNQRALSMAQQTKAGHVYVISNVGSFGENVYKIGLTRRLEPIDRIRELGDASVPFDFDVHALIRSDDAPGLENALHRLFVDGQVNKVNPRKEFFRVAIQQIRDEVERLGLQASWTMQAEAAEYRETIAIERALEAKTLDAGQWAAHQIEEHDAAAAKVAEPVDP